MKRPAFTEGVLYAVILGILGSLAYTGLHLFITGRQALWSAVTFVCLIYLVHLLKRSPERTGRVTVFSCWLLITAGLWLIQPSFTAFILAQAAMLWLVRSLYFYASVLSALADSILTGLALAAVVWGVTYTGSVFFCIWSFFLIQALYITIPPDWTRPSREKKINIDHEDRFEQAHRCAEAAIRKLSSL